MALVCDTFDGINIIIAGAQNALPGTPQVTQEEKLPGIDGTRAIQHGRSGRIIEIRGFVTAADAATLLAAEAAIQEMIGYVATLVRYMAGSSNTYPYCRLLDYYTFGPFGYEPGGVVDRNAMALFKNDVW